MSLTAEHPADGSAHTGDEDRWEAVLDRDDERAGRFVYAVVTTGVYCNPSCPSRRPKRENARFFSSPATAELAGFRACRRCRPADGGAARAALDRVVEACRAIDAAGGPLPQAELAARCGLSPRQLHRTFTTVVGVTARAYGEAVRTQRARDALRTEPTVIDAVFAAGYGSTRSFYEQAGQRLGMAPALYASGGPVGTVAWSSRTSSIGMVVAAASDRGLCAVRLGDDAPAMVDELVDELPASTLCRDDDRLAPTMDALAVLADGDPASLPIPFDVRATAFQARVWDALTRIPRGETRSYGEIATAIGEPTAARAVAGACAANPLALAVPCHRVVRADGTKGGYRWGTDRKDALLESERRAGAS